MNEKQQPIMDVFTDEVYNEYKPRIKHAIELMTDETLSHMRGFINFARDKGMSDAYISKEISHDLFGILRDETGFAPRIGKDYAQYDKQVA